MKMIDHDHFICHFILGIFTEYPELNLRQVVIFNSIAFAE